MNNSDKLRSFSANQSSNMYNTELQSKSVFQQIPKVKFVAEGPSFISRISHSKRNKKYETEGTVYGIINIKT